MVKCFQDNCKGTVDKYIEYDPVIVMIDLILMSKEAQRHVIYNTDFKVCCFNRKQYLKWDLRHKTKLMTFNIFSHTGSFS